MLFFLLYCETDFWLYGSSFGRHLSPDLITGLSRSSLGMSTSLTGLGTRMAEGSHSRLWFSYCSGCYCPWQESESSIDWKAMPSLNQEDKECQCIQGVGDLKMSGKVGMRPDRSFNISVVWGTKALWQGCFSISVVLLYATHSHIFFECFVIAVSAICNNGGIGWMLVLQ